MSAKVLIDQLTIMIISHFLALENTIYSNFDLRLSNGQGGSTYQGILQARISGDDEWRILCFRDTLSDITTVSLHCMLYEIQTCLTFTERTTVSEPSSACLTLM